MFRVILRTYKMLLFAHEPDEHIRVFAVILADTEQQAGQKRRAAPVVNPSITLIYMIEVGAHHNLVLRIARQHADHVWRLLFLDELFGKLIGWTSRLCKQLLQLRFTIE